MRDRYYLSVYLYINKLAYLTKKELRHDQSIALWKEEEDKISLVHYWELERITGLKQHRRAFYDVNQAREIIEMLLSEYNLSICDMEEIWGTPELDSSNNYHSIRAFPTFCYHNICHLYSSMLSNTDLFNHKKILSLAVDGVPDNLIDIDIENKYFYTGCISDNGQIKHIFPIYSPGILWSIAAMHFKKREGTLMALVSATECKLLDVALDEVYIKKASDVSGVVDSLNNLFSYVDKLTLEDEGVKYNFIDKKYTFEECKISMVMKMIQKCSFEIMEKNIEEIISKYNINIEEYYLCISGGFGLNCPCNSRLMVKYNFKGFIGTPCVSDSGMALGIGLYSIHQKRAFKSFEFKLENAFYGDNIKKIKETLVQYDKYIVNKTHMKYEQVAKDINEGPVVWVNGRAEIGPRALGHRSILGNPCEERTKLLLNQIKKRQWWRPIAPIVLADKCDKWFEEAYESRYMLHTFKVRKEKRTLVPAITHTDMSARVQTITEQENPELYQIIKKYDEMYKVPIICNTSLNDKGEPIINTLEETINFILRKRIKVAYFNGVRVEFKGYEQYSVLVPEKRKIDFDNYIPENVREEELARLNPLGINNDLLQVYVEHPRLYNKLDLSSKRDIRLLKAISKLRMSKIHMK